MEKELEKLTTGVDFLQDRWDELKAKEQYILDRLNRIPRIKHILLPDACINLTVGLDFAGTDLEWAERLMQAGTLFMPASGYGYDPVPATLRITFAEREEKLIHAMDTLKRVMEQV